MKAYSLNIDENAQFVHETAKDKGFWDGPDIPDVYLAKMALIASEVSEILEAYRKEQGPERIAEEFADVYIRLVDLWAGMKERGVIPEDISLQETIISKAEKNASRPKKHGNLI